MKVDLINMSDEELGELHNSLKEEFKRRKFLNMSDDELFRVAKAKNGEFSDEEALKALNVLLKKDKPDLSIIAALKQMSHSEQIRETCKEFLYR